MKDNYADIMLANNLLRLTYGKEPKEAAEIIATQLSMFCAIHGYLDTSHAIFKALMRLVKENDAICQEKGTLSTSDLNN